MASSSLLPPPTFANKYHALLHPHGARHRLTRCGAAAADGGPGDELLSSALHLGRPDPVVATVVSDTGTDGWGDLFTELKRSLQSDSSDPAASGAASIGAAVPDELLSSPPASEAGNAGAALLVPDEVLTSASDMVTTDGVGAAVDAIPDELLGALHLDASSPAVRVADGALSQLEELTAGMNEAERWALFGIVAVTWLYLTARPGVLSGAVDTYVLAPLQQALDTVLGRRSLTMSDFVVGERIGEGSFGVVYSGAVVPRGGPAIEERAGKAKTKLQLDDRYKEKVILKKIKVGTVGAKECGDYEEWFNYRVARAAPESCADFMGSFVADKTKSEFVKGGKWLVWKFESYRCWAKLNLLLIECGHYQEILLLLAGTSGFVLERLFTHDFIAWPAIWFELLLQIGLVSPHQLVDLLLISQENECRCGSYVELRDQFLTKTIYRNDI
uniref:Predicted protein n=1 Tax=Hordeum vulgare subsp. vulgare TaxID=112509 RepID=F2CTH7_HORVV|nr:predicted protein [Hordeum vulgare subsp. vulgare]